MDEIRSSDLDPSVRRAYEEAKTKMTIGPLVKEELKLTILKRRHSQGMADIVLDDKKSTIKRELTEEEIHKKLRRKEQNRRAAERCRQKKKTNNEKLLIEYSQEQEKEKSIQLEIELLEKQKADLQRILDEHECQKIPTPNQTPAFDDRTSFTFSYSSCPILSYQQEPVPHRDTQTPFQQDDLDEINDFHELMYHTESPSEKDLFFDESPMFTFLQPLNTGLLNDILLLDNLDEIHLSPGLRDNNNSKLTASCFQNLV